MQADQRRAQPAQGRLSLAADVEQPGMVRHRDRETGENEIGRVVEREAEPLAGAQRAAQQDGGRLQRVLADREHHEARDQERRDDRERGHQHQ